VVYFFLNQIADKVIGMNLTYVCILSSKDQSSGSDFHTRFLLHPDPEGYESSYIECTLCYRKKIIHTPPAKKFAVRPNAEEFKRFT
jgi:hypothetical protein